MADITNHDGTGKAKRRGNNKSKNQLVDIPTADINNPDDKEIESLPVTSLLPFHNHPFKLHDGERLSDMARSIKEYPCGCYP